MKVTNPILTAKQDLASDLFRGWVIATGKLVVMLSKGESKLKEIMTKGELIPKANFLAGELTEEWIVGKLLAGELNILFGSRVIDIVDGDVSDDGKKFIYDELLNRKLVLETRQAKAKFLANQDRKTNNFDFDGVRNETVKNFIDPFAEPIKFDTPKKTKK